MCVCACAQSLQLCPTLCNTMDSVWTSPSGTSISGIFLARMLEWVDMPSFMGSQRVGHDWAASTSREHHKFRSVQFSRSVVSLGPHEPQHTRPPCPSPTPGVYPNSCPLSWSCHPMVSSSVIPFSSHLQSFPASGSFPISQFFLSGSQSIGFSA